MTSEKRDPNFVCRCGGNIVYVRTRDDGRKIFQCESGLNRFQGELVACIICERPKTIWSDDGNICGGCCVRFM